MTGIVGSTFSNSKVLGAADRMVIDGITSITTGAGAEQIYRYYPGNLSGTFNHLVTAFTPRQQCVLSVNWQGHHNFSSGARYFVIGMRQGAEELTDDHFQTMQTGSDGTNTDVWGGSFHTYQTGGWYGFSQNTVFSLQRDITYRVRLMVTNGSCNVNGSEIMMRFDLPASHQH